MNTKAIVVTLKGPNGIELDITRRLKLGGIGTITEGAEEEILELTHGDMNLTLDDRDRVLRGLFDDAEVADRWELVILTETGRAQGLKWDRLFAGVLDLPWSVSSDPGEDEITIQVFSYTKDLERASAAGVKRTLAFKTASITAATSQLVFFGTEASDLEVGDVVRLNDGTNIEDFTVVRKIDSANVITSAPASRTFTSQFAEVITPFYHDKSPSDLVALVAAAAGNPDFRVLDPTIPISKFPIATPLSIADLNIGAVPQSLAASGGGIIATFQVADGTKRKTLASPTATWADGATSNLAQADWTPYTDVDPGTLLDFGSSIAADTGILAADYPHGHVWTITAVGSGTFTLHLNKDFVDQGAISPALAGFSSALGNGWWSHDYIPDYDGLLISYNDNAGTRAIKYMNVFGLVLSTLSSSYSGRIRTVRYNTGTICILVDDVTGAIEFWDLLVPSAGMRRRIARPANDYILTWTIRTWGNGGTIDGIASKLWMTFLFERQGETWVAIYDARGSYMGWSLVAEYRISAKVSDSLLGGSFNQKRRRAYQTILDPGGDDPKAVIFAGGVWSVLATHYAGVVPYADFKDRSCAAALKDLAILTLSYLDVDRYRSFDIAPRPSLFTAPVIQTIGAPLERTSRPIWEFYRAAVKVSGTDTNRDTFEVVQGNAGDSARTLEISSPLITTPGVAFAVAQFYAGYLNRKIRQEDIRIDEPEEPVRVLDIVSFDDRRWLATQVQSNVKEREQTIRLFEVSGVATPVLRRRKMEDLGIEVWHRAIGYDGTTLPDISGHGHHATAHGGLASGPTDPVRPVKYAAGTSKGCAQLAAIATEWAVVGPDAKEGWFQWDTSPLPTMNTSAGKSGFTIGFIIKDWGAEADGGSPGYMLGAGGWGTIRHTVDVGLSQAYMDWDFGHHYFQATASAHTPNNACEEHWIIQCDGGVTNQLRCWLNGSPLAPGSGSSYQGAYDVFFNILLLSNGGWAPFRSRSLSEIFIIPRALAPGGVPSAEIDLVNEYLAWRRAHGEQTFISSLFKAA